MVRITTVVAGVALLSTAFASPAPQTQARTTLDTVNGRANVGAANCKQFITGECTSNEDCHDGCCAGLAVADPTTGASVVRGICSGIAVGNAAGKLGCNFPANDGKLSAICPNGPGDTPAVQKVAGAAASTPIYIGGAQAGTQNGAQCSGAAAAASG